MNTMHTNPDQRDMARLHPAVYKIMLGLVLWMLLAAWGFVAGGYSAIALGMVTFFLVVTMGLVAALWRISRRNRMSGLDKGRSRSFGAWLDGEFDTWGSRLHGTHAATQIILPIAAAAVGMTLLMIVLHLDLAT
ncbi:MAG TPA: hypothetical protein VHW66_23545 [Stellaceae bacterium]|jgi:FtsH-binding integral membrane protein|nr:hypothetical protein [Stellaceae bacterium]